MEMARMTTSSAFGYYDPSSQTLVNLLRRDTNGMYRVMRMHFPKAGSSDKVYLTDVNQRLYRKLDALNLIHAIETDPTWIQLATPELIMQYRLMGLMQED